MQLVSIYIKNMVCERCKMVVEQVFKNSNIDTATVALGEVKITAESVTVDKLATLDKKLIEHGFERIDDKKGKTLEQIKSAIIDVIHHKDHFELKINWSVYLSGKLQYDYNYLSNLFSSVTGTTLEQYIIKQKVEKVKEHLFYDELSVKEIAFKLGYSSVAHLSAQFKKVTGLTPTEFKDARKDNIRKSLDHIL